MHDGDADMRPGRRYGVRDADKPSGGLQYLSQKRDTGGILARRQHIAKSNRPRPAKKAPRSPARPSLGRKRPKTVELLRPLDVAHLVGASAWGKSA
jgi:hypothetical protein